MRQLIVITLLIQTLFANSQTTTFDTLYFAGKKFPIKKSATSLMSGQDFPFAIFHCEYAHSGKPWTYFATKECNCTKSGTMIDLQANTLEVKICNSSDKIQFTEYNLIDTLILDLKNIYDKPRIKTSDNTHIINSIQFKIVYDNSTRILSTTNDYQFPSLNEYIRNYPDFKFIVVEQMFYQDKNEKIYILPYTFLIRQK